MKRVLISIAMSVIITSGVGCGSSTDQKLIRLTSAGDFGAARERLRGNMSEKESDREFLLDRMRMGMVSLADGVPECGEIAFEQTYDKLRTQGVNDDNTLAIFMTGDKINFWKGEPFEQAMAFHYVGLWNAMQGEWGNTRAASGDSLFQLKDFSDDSDEPVTAEEMIKKSATWEGDEEDSDYLESGYVAVESDFALGHLMNAIANQQLGRTAEARDNFRAAANVNPELRGLARDFESGRHNAILVVDYGQGPEKYARGRDNAIADFRPRLASGGETLLVTVGGSTKRYPVACDLNAMALNHRWRGVEDIRIAKSRIGDFLVVAGAGVAGVGVYNDSSDAAIVGAAMMIAGLIQKASAAADTTHCEVMPQRVYVVPVTLPANGSRIELQVDGVSHSRMVLAGLKPRRDNQARLHYVRLVSTGEQAPAWATSGVINYCNDEHHDVPGQHLPYILGGNCACTPSDELLDSYQAAGFLTGMTVSDLRQLYIAEGIEIAGRSEGDPGLHVLEGGDWLYTPSAGTAGYARLYGQEHAPYRPSSGEVRQLAAKIATDRALASGN